MDGYLGTILPVGILFAPRNWTDCQGQSLTIQQYAALYSLLGVTYGGDARTNFNLPNLMGRFPLGYGTTPGTSARYSMGATGGVNQVTLTMNNLPQHSHPASASVAVSMSGMTVTLPSFNATATTTTTVKASSSLGTTSTPSDNSYLAGVLTKNGPATYQSSLYVAPTPTTTVSLGGVSSSTSVSVTPAGAASVTGQPTAAATVAVGANPTSNNAVNTMPPFAAVRFIICTSGLYPARN